ncbi:HipA domain-containing protein [Streptobacillus felis]|uniref:HipA domain-containing protein n=1 Tax=Streptobacillus felis TaxID=1384509 RepID=UPI000830DC00|nr:HipA domain-containing protein [Streptobacillus felis]
MIKDFNNIVKNYLVYGGNAGFKLGFINESNENWFLKFPKTTKNMINVDMSYNTSPLSEYIGSHIYEILGFNVHKTELGVYKDKIVVACKDFIEGNRFEEFKNFQNNFSDNFSIDLEEFQSKNRREYELDIEELYIIINDNNIESIKELKNRFWDMFVVDMFINNNDRHSGNFGFIYNNKIELAPIYDNGNSFFSKHSDNKKKIILEDNQMKNSIINTGQTPYTYKDKKIDSVKSILKAEIKLGDINNEINIDLRNAIIRNTIKIENNINKIKEFINNIPEQHQGKEIISKLTKEFYNVFLENRLEKLILGKEKAIEINNSINKWNKNKKIEYRDI